MHIAQIVNHHPFQEEEEAAWVCLVAQIVLHILLTIGLGMLEIRINRLMIHSYFQDITYGIGQSIISARPRVGRLECNGHIGSDKLLVWVYNNLVMVLPIHLVDVFTQNIDSFILNLLEFFNQMVQVFMIWEVMFMSGARISMGLILQKVRQIPQDPQLVTSV